MPPRVSVIVLVHNAAATVRQTLDAIDAQTLADHETVIVDDGSDDGSRAVIGGWLEAHPRFRATVITHDLCRGTAASTADALRQCRGEWVIRCDADDTLRPDALRALTDEGDTCGAGVVWGAMEVTDGRRSLTLHPSPRCGDLNHAPVDTVTFSLCNKVIRRRLLTDNGIMPVAGADCWEDLGMVSRVLALRPRVRMLRETVYVYNQDPRRPSLSRSRRGKLLEDHLLVAGELVKWFDARGLAGEYSQWLDRLKLCAKVKLLRGRGKDVARWRAIWPEIHPRILGISHIKIAYRLLFAAVAVLPVRLSQSVADFCDRFYRAE